MAKALSPEEALAEVRGYTGLDLAADEIRSLHEILKVPRNDTAIITHLRTAHHPLGDLQHLPEGENWWDKVHEDMLVAADDPYIEEPPGTHKQPVAHDRNAAIFWLEHKILPALTGQADANATSDEPGAGVQDQPEGSGKLATSTPGGSGQGPLADPKKRRALESYAMDAATAYYRARGWHVEHVHDTKKVLDLWLVHTVSGEVRRVEVKGSSQAASHVEVTKAEVAKSREEACELFVLDKILYHDTGPGPDDYTCQGGRRRAGKWCADDKDLEPKTYDYHLAADFGEPSASLASPPSSAPGSVSGSELRVSWSYGYTGCSTARLAAGHRPGQAGGRVPRRLACPAALRDCAAEVQRPPVEFRQRARLSWNSSTRITRTLVQCPLETAASAMTGHELSLLGAILRFDRTSPEGGAMTANLADRLLEAVLPTRVHTAIVVRAVYQPVGGAERTIMPPTYPVTGERDPNARYLMDSRLVDGEQRRTVVIDQEPSQANRVEEALRDASDAGLLQLPLFEMRTGGIRLTSLDFPHRYADAYVRDSLVEGVRFDQSPVGKRLRSTTAADVRPLYEREPCSLLFGAWDSHRKGRWPKFARLYAATMYGLDPVAGRRMGGRLDPVNLTGAVEDSAKAEADWKFIPEGAKAKGTKLSEIGHGNIAPNPVPGGVTVSEIRRVASISLAGLERLRFGDAPPEAAALARAALAALALAGDRLAFGRPSVWLRSGCDLANVTETLGLERPGGAVDDLAVTAQDALRAFEDLRQRAAKAGIPMDSDTVTLAPVPDLAEAIRFAVTSGTQEDEG